MAEKNIGFGGRLSRKDCLLSIDEYAAKKEVSIESVEQSVRSGVVQFRRHKGKTFIIDQPLKNHSQTTDPIVFPVYQQNKNSLWQNHAIKPEDIPAGSISKLAWKMYRKSHPSDVTPIP